MADGEHRLRRGSLYARQTASEPLGVLPNKRLELAGAAKQGSITFVRQMTMVKRARLCGADGCGARSSSAVR